MQNEDSKKAAEPLEGAEATPGSILIVDDEEGVRAMLVELFRNEGFDCLVASDGEKALEILDDNTPSLGVLDLALPGISGAELALRIRERLPDVPLVALSGQLKLWETDDLKDLGFVRIFAKPMDCDDFVRYCKEAANPGKAAS